MNETYKSLCDNASTMSRNDLVTALNKLLDPLDLTSLKALAKNFLIYCPTKSKASLRAALSRRPLLVNDLSGEIV